MAVPGNLSGEESAPMKLKRDMVGVGDEPPWVEQGSIPTARGSYSRGAPSPPRTEPKWLDLATQEHF